METRLHLGLKSLGYTVSESDIKTDGCSMFFVNSSQESTHSLGVRVRRKGAIVVSSQKKEKEFSGESYVYIPKETRYNPESFPHKDSVSNHKNFLNPEELKNLQKLIFDINYLFKLNSVKYIIQSENFNEV